jgi:ParB-like chromosome segregation protein Spo0J
MSTAQERPPESSGPERRFYAATRAGKKKVTATLAPSDHKRLRRLALERDLTTEALLAEAISDLFTKYDDDT